MFTEFLRDQAFAIAWLGLMAGAWFGWSQEDPAPRLRGWLGAGSILGMLVAIGFGLLVWRNWGTETALEGRYWVFGVVVAAEVILIGGGCAVLAKRRATRWFGWWIGLCVALHFVPLAWVFADWSYLGLAAIQVIGLLAMRPALVRGDYPTSRWACPWIGVTFLAFALVSGGIFLAKFGYPF
ncbi:hypothetical protein [Leucobacter luti]|uniref:hypothetical protein n=1 Tax=Leucobacter luti TaxID=340320 RepID=UPI003D001B11